MTHLTDAPDTDRLFDLPALARYTGLSVKTLQRYIDDPVRPLPSHYVQRGGAGRGRHFVALRDWVRWVEAFPPQRAAKHAQPADPDAVAWRRKLAKPR
jgi:hypothetical protein